MKRALSIIVSALVAVSFAATLWAADNTGTGMDGNAGPGTGITAGDQSDQGAAGTRPTKKAKKKKKRTKKARRQTRRTTGLDNKPNYGKPDLGGPSGTMGTGGTVGTGPGTGADGTTGR